MESSCKIEEDIVKGLNRVQDLFGFPICALSILRTERIISVAVTTGGIKDYMSVLATSKEEALKKLQAKMALDYYLKYELIKKRFH